MSRILFTILPALLLSCTILEDTDVTSFDELRKLKLKSIQITETSNGIADLKTALVTEEDINKPVKIYDDKKKDSVITGILTKRKTITWPAFTKAKFQFRSGVTSDITLVSEYLTNGKIKFWKVKSGGKEVEKYEFLYNSNGILGNMKTTIIINSDTATYSDSYSSDVYNFPMNRDSSTKAHPKGETVASFQGDAITPNNPCYHFVWQYPRECTTATPSVCTWKNKKEYNYCLGNNLYIVTPAGAGGRIQFQVLQTELLEEVYVAESQSGGTCCTDKFYFHPYLFMPGDLRIKIMYAPDWWKEETSFSGDIDQSVRLKFNYE